MNWKLWMRQWRYLEEAGGAGDGGAGGGSGGGAGGAGDQGGKGDQGGAGDGGAGDQGGGEDAKPFLGGDQGGDKGGDKGDKDGQGIKGGKPDEGKTYEEKDYLEGIKKDEALLGKDANVQLDTDLIKAMSPTFKELGIAPEQASKLSNALAKAQIEQAKAYQQSRLDYFKEMKEKSMQIYQEGDWKTINAGIDHYFKPDGVMNHVIRNSELGADPEFLALMLEVGKAHLVDGAAGGAAGAGGGNQGGGLFSGISAQW